MVHVYFVYMYHVPKVHVFAVKTQWKHMKTLAKQCIPCIKYGTCVFAYKCFCSEKTVKTHENTSKTVHFIYKVWNMCIFGYMYHVPKVHVSAVKTQWKHMKTLAKQCISCKKYGTCVFLYTCTMYQKYMFLQWKHSENTWKH